LTVFEAWVRRWWIDDLALVDRECGPFSGTRQRRQLADTDGEFVDVLITRVGRETVSQGDAEVELEAADAVAWDRTKPARFAVWEPLSKRSLLIPRAALDEVSGRAWMTGGVRLNGLAVSYISPTPLLMLTAQYDVLAPTEPAVGATRTSRASTRPAVRPATGSSSTSRPDLPAVDQGKPDIDNSGVMLDR
jgi:AraC family transcriptional activator of tynA and feaB